MTCDNYLPSFQAQNPAISGDKYGWYDCTAFSAAMAGAFDSCGQVALTGGTIRAQSNEPIPDPASPGLNLGQVDTVLNSHGVDLDVRYRMPWSDFVSAIEAGHGAILQVLYAPIADSSFDAGGGFRGGHALFVPPGWGVMDPLADGRHAGIYKYHGQVYPVSLLRDAAGKLPIGAGMVVGAGYCYAALTLDQRSNWQATVRPMAGTTRKAFFRYFVSSTGVVSGRVMRYTGGFQTPVTAPSFHQWPGHAGRRLVRITKPTSSMYGWWIDAVYAKEIP